MLSQMDRWCPPPKRFRKAVQVTRARFSARAPYFCAGNSASSARPALAEGKRYENKALSYLSWQFGEKFIAGPWLQYWHSDGEAWCQPDALIIDFPSAHIIIAEVKLKHTSDAWWQLAQKYEPVVSAIFPRRLWRICCVEIVRWYDPQVSFPVRPVLRKSLHDLRSDKLNVHVFNDRYARFSATG